MLETRRLTDPDADKIVQRLTKGIGFPAVLSGVSGEVAEAFEKEGAPKPPDYWKKLVLGYDRKFLSLDLDLGKILSGRRKKAAKLKNADGVVLDYLHFSTVLDRDRKFPMLTAVNIFGSKLIHPGKRAGVWRRDACIADEFQPGDNFYLTSEAVEKVYFDRGHLVRRLDPCWGDKVWRMPKLRRCIPFILRMRHRKCTSIMTRIGVIWKTIFWIGSKPRKERSLFLRVRFSRILTLIMDKTARGVRGKFRRCIGRLRWSKSRITLSLPQRLWLGITQEH